MIGRIDALELSAKGATIKKGERLFSIRQGGRTAVFHGPISGQIHEVHAELPKHLDWLTRRPYEHGWVCSMTLDHLADELGQLHIGEEAAAWYQAEITRLRQTLGAAHGEIQASAEPTNGGLTEGQLEEADDATSTRFTQVFLQGRPCCPRKEWRGPGRGVVWPDSAQHARAATNGGARASSIST
jgi:glycine cleavage system H lipoate-binding protein